MTLSRPTPLMAFDDAELLKEIRARGYYVAPVPRAPTPEPLVEESHYEHG